MDFRKALEKDFQTLIEMSRSFMTSPFTFDKRFLSLSESFNPVFAQDMIQNPASLSIVAEDKTGICGFITISVNQPISKALGKKIGNILLLVVNEKHRGKGIGKCLTQKGAGLLKSMGVEIITVGTDIYNIPAVHVYESCGFKLCMGWHIYRFYNDDKGGKDSLSRNIHPYDPSTIQPFIEHFSRPVSLLKDKNIPVVLLKNFLVEKLKQNILKKNSVAYQYYHGDKPVGLIHVQKDELARKTIGIDRPIFKILDLIVLSDDKNKGIQVKMLHDIIARLEEYSLIEIWIESGNSLLIHSAEEAGFHLCYTGLSLHLKLA